MEDAQVQSVSTPLFVQIMSSFCFVFFVCFFMAKCSPGIWSVFILNPFQGSSSLLLLSTICDCALKGSGDAASKLNRQAWDSLHLPLDM